MKKTEHIESIDLYRSSLEGTIKKFQELYDKYKDKYKNLVIVNETQPDYYNSYTVETYLQGEREETQEEKEAREDAECRRKAQEEYWKRQRYASLSKKEKKEIYKQLKEEFENDTKKKTVKSKKKEENEPLEHCWG